MSQRHGHPAGKCDRSRRLLLVFRIECDQGARPARKCAACPRIGEGESSDDAGNADSTSKSDASAAKAKPKPEFIDKTPAEWRGILTRVQFAVTREKATEPAFTGKYATGHFRGTFVCVCCDAAHVAVRALQRADQVRFRHGLAQLLSSRLTPGPFRPPGTTAESSRDSRSCAGGAGPISATSSTTVRRRPACVFASIPSPSSSFRLRPKADPKDAGRRGGRRSRK